MFDILSWLKYIIYFQPAASVSLSSDALDPAAQFFSKALEKKTEVQNKKLELLDLQMKTQQVILKNEEMKSELLRLQFQKARSSTIESIVSSQSSVNSVDYMLENSLTGL